MSEAISACSTEFNLFPILLQNTQKQKVFFDLTTKLDRSVHMVLQNIILFMPHQVRQLLRSSECDNIS